MKFHIIDELVNQRLVWSIPNDPALAKEIDELLGICRAINITVYRPGYGLHVYEDFFLLVDDKHERFIAYCTDDRIAPLLHQWIQELIPHATQIANPWFREDC